MKNLQVSGVLLRHTTAAVTRQKQRALSNQRQVRHDGVGVEMGVFMLALNAIG